jgi:hypothetical protein
VPRATGEVGAPGQGRGEREEGVGRGSPWAGDGERRCSDGDGRGGVGTDVWRAKTLQERGREAGVHIAGREMGEMSSMVVLEAMAGGPHKQRRRLPKPTAHKCRLGRGARAGGSSAGPRGAKSAQDERGEREEGRLGGLRRGPKRPGPHHGPKGQQGMEGGFWGVFSYILFSPKLLLNEYFMETKQMHTKRIDVWPSMMQQPMKIHF